MSDNEFNELIKFSEKSEKLGLTLEEFIIMFLGFSPQKKVEGKTRLQKLIYILNSRYNLFDNLNFFRYYYGPFSIELEDVIDRLKQLGYINEEIIHFKANPFYYQINRSLTELGLKKFEDLKSKYEKNAKKLKEMILSTLKTDKYDYYTIELQNLLNIVYDMAGYNK